MEEPDEVGQGEERATREPVRWLGTRWDRAPRAVRAAAVAVAGAVVGVLVWQGLHPTPQRTAGRPTPSLAPQSALLVAQDICTTFVGPTLEVTFQLSNVGQQPVRVVAVRPELPLGMLLTLGATLDNGHCGSSSGASSGPADPRVLASGASIPVTFRLLPLVDCPQPAPVQAAVDIAGNSPQATITIPVLPDLGSIRFTGCHATAAQAGPAP